MDYFLGIDAGGTKTLYYLADELGNVKAVCRGEGCSYPRLGAAGVAAELQKGITSCMKQAHIGREQLRGTCVGLPFTGEIKGMETEMEAKLESILGSERFYLTNDAEVGWAGSFGLRPGINVVSGTGAIGFGKDRTGGNARCGGWSDFFGDEGSCHWMGVKMMELYSKQADGRLERGPLYDIVTQELRLGDELDFIRVMQEEYIPDRKKTAGLQCLMLKAAKAGDGTVKDIYTQAAGELALLVKGIRNRLEFGKELFAVSYSGGLFHAEEFLLPEFERLVNGLGGRLRKPLSSPVTGALLLAFEHFDKDRLKYVREGYKI